jgi:uracil-DNA glycosylase family 4
MKPDQASQTFDIDCTRCPRLVDFLAQVRHDHPHYHARPVAPFGDARARLLVVGLAPGMHGANATGRPFTGDHAGILLYQTLFHFGFSSQPESVRSDDGLKLKDCRITNAVKCLPPANKPSPIEVRNCRDYLQADLRAMAPGGVLVALGRIAHEAVLRCLDIPLKQCAFAHGAMHALGVQNLTLLDSYHCSRYNTQTRRLTTPMFEAIFAQARALLDARSP